MNNRKGNLPQLAGGRFITDGGIETSLVFHEKLPLPDFAAFSLLRSEAGRTAVDRQLAGYAKLAVEYGVGCVLESVTWRASADWGERLGYSAKDLAAANNEAVQIMRDLRQRFETAASPVVVSGCLGPRGDGYDPKRLMTADEAQAYHSPQIETLCDAGAELITALTMTHPEEAIGIARAAAAAKMPVVISFTVETDGRLPTGHSLDEAMRQVEDATQGGPAYYMINCAHPSHFADVLLSGGDWTKRIRGLRANASIRSHAELNEAAELDDGDPQDFGRRHRKLADRLPQLTILGGCCGTDARHVEEVCKAMDPKYRLEIRN